MSSGFAQLVEVADVLEVAIFDHSESWAWRRGERDHFNLWLALEGEGEFDIAGRRWPFSSGSVFLFPPETRLTGRATGGVRTINFSAHIRCRAEVPGLDELAQGGRPVTLRHFIWASHLCRHLCETFYLSREGGRNLVVSGLGLLLESMAFERELAPGLGGGRAMIETIERIRRNPAAAYTVGEMAAAAGLSTAQFTRRFRGVTGLSPNRFIIEERLGRAESYLRETGMSVQEIASRLGYRDVYYFSRQFRRFRGVTPSRVRGRGLRAER
ncbi:MAG: AraC family transcriptional regulator [Chthoniobacterales bacterium]